MATTTTPRSRIISSSDLAWQESRPGITFKVLWEDAGTKRGAQMTRFAPGARLPRHRHGGDELIFVIEGALTDEAGTVTAGNVVYRPDRCVHNVSTQNGATAPAVLTGDIELTHGPDSPARPQILPPGELPRIDPRPGVGPKRTQGSTG